MTYKRYNWIFIGLIFFGVVSYLLLVVLVDPFRVFGLTGFNQKNFVPNSRYLKIEHLRQHNFDVYILGSSRVNNYRVDLVQDLLGASCYNISVSAENLRGILNKLKWLIKKQRHLDKVIIGLDYDFMFQNGPLSTEDLLRVDHYLVSGKNPIHFYSQYFKFQYSSIRRTIKDNLFKDRVDFKVDLKSGHWRLESKDQLRANDPGQYVLQQNYVKPFSNRKSPILKSNLDLFFEMARYINDHNVEAVFIINPYHHGLMSSFSLADYNRWLRRLATSGQEVWDFSGFNAMTKEDLNYYAISHFNDNVGDCVLQKIFGSAEGQNNCPDDFGTRLSPDNVELHISDLQRSFAAYKKITVND